MKTKSASTSSVIFILMLAWIMAGIGLVAPVWAAVEQEVVFIVDGSGSIDSTDFQIQKDGIEFALENATVIPRDGTVAVAVVQFSTSFGDASRVEVPYTVINTAADVTTVVNGVQGMSQIRGATNPGDGIRKATLHLGPHAQATANQGYCLSTDGLRNSGVSPSIALDEAKTSSFELDSFSVIAIEDPPNFFEADFESAYGGLVFGGGTVFVVRNAAEFATTVGSLCFPTELTLVGMEVVQVSQDLENSVPLIEEKTTVVRTYFEPMGPDPEVAQARLRGFRGGSELSGSPLTATNPGGTITADANALDRRGNLNDSLNFRLPDSWTSGDVTLEVEPVGAILDCQEAAGPTANDCETTVDFDPAPEVEVKLVKVKYTSGSSTIIPSNADLNTLENRLLAIFPTHQIDRTSGTVDMGAGKPSFKEVNSRLELMRILDFCWTIFGCDRRYYGAYDQLSSGGGLANGIPGTVASGVIRDGNNYGRNRHAHEIGHTLGRAHAGNQAQVGTTVIDGTTYKQGPCGSISSLSSPEFPYIETVSGNQRATLGPLTAGDDKKVYGYDTLRNTVVDPTQNFELMAYCPGFRWASKFTYEGILSQINSIFSISSTSPLVASSSTSLFMLIRGLIDLNTGDVEFQPVASLESSTLPPVLPTGDYELEVLDDVGGVLESIAFSPVEMGADVEFPETPDTPPESGLFIIPILADPAIAQINVNLSGSTLGSLFPSANPPTVEVVFPNGGENLTGDSATFQWTGSDPDGDPLTYTVQFSPDNGTTWDTLITDHPDTSLNVDLNELPETLEGLVRVQVSDGFHTAEDTSDATFTTPNSPPEVTVLSPADGDFFVGVQNITLQAGTHDTEDGTLPDGSLDWESDLDGALGTGNGFSLLASDLSEGNHVITVTGTDSGGLSDSDSVEIGVFRVAPPPVVSDILANPDVLWPPNHKMVPIELTVEVEDTFDPPTCVVASVTSNEAEDIEGAGKKGQADWMITGDLSVKLRAERSGTGEGREYSINVECTDVFGNVTTESALVTVPHSQKK